MGAILIAARGAVAQLQASQVNDVRDLVIVGLAVAVIALYIRTNELRAEVTVLRARLDDCLSTRQVTVELPDDEGGGR